MQVKFVRIIAIFQLVCFLTMIGSPSVLAYKDSLPPSSVAVSGDSAEVEISGAVMGEVDNAAKTEENSAQEKSVPVPVTSATLPVIKPDSSASPVETTSPDATETPVVTPTPSQPLPDVSPEVSEPAEKTVENVTQPEASPSVSETAAPENTDSTNNVPAKEDPKKDEESVTKITGIVVEGNNLVPTDEIISVISVKIGDPLVESKIQRDIQSIFDMGYFTDVKVDTRYFIGGIKLVYSVFENPVVKNIQLVGNKLADTEKLRFLMTVKIGQILNTKDLYTDLAAINQYYDEELGYLLKPSHVKDMSWTEDGSLTIFIADGMVIKDIEITGNTIFPTEELRKFVTLREGEVFNQKKAKEITDKISSLYEEKDYILDNVRASVEPDKGLVSIKVVEAVVEEIKVDGNKRTKDYVVYRNMNTKVGQVLRRKRIQKDLERLNGLGYFSAVEVEPEAGSAPGKVILVMKVKEQKTGSASIGLGYMGSASSAIRSGVTGGLSYSEKNFKGTGWGFGANTQLGMGASSGSIYVFNPAINNNRDSIGVTVYTQNYMEIPQPISSNPLTYAYYDDHRNGVALSYGRPLSEFFTAYLTLKTEKIDLERSGKSEHEPLGLFSGRVNSAIMSGVYDTRDDLFNPMTGMFVNGSYQSAGGLLGGDEDFSKIQLEIRKYIKIGRSFTLALRAMGGSISSGRAYTSEYFYMGGTDTLRAYKDNIFIGDRMLLFNAEYRFPIAKLKILSGAVFVDAGNAWFKERGDSSLYTDAGVGLRLTLPSLGLGVIRFDYAFGQDGSRLTIGFGQSF